MVLLIMIRFGGLGHFIVLISSLWLMGRGGFHYRESDYSRRASCEGKNPNRNGR